MKIGVLGNCQAESFAASIAALCPACEVAYVSVADILADTNVDVLAQKLHGSNVLFSQDMEYAHESLKSSSLSEKIERTIIYPAIAFNGFHPDLIYVTADGKYIHGVMGPYQSTIALACFLEKIEVDQAVELFNMYTYSSLGYLNTFELAKDVLTKKTEQSGYDVSELFEQGRTAAFMHTINHPVIEAVFLLAKQGLQKAGICAVAAPPPADPLAIQPIWPVYPEIAQRFGWESGFTFRNKEKLYGLGEFVKASYEVYARHASIDQSGPLERARSFIRSEVVGGKVPVGVTVEDVRQGFYWLLGRTCEDRKTAEAHARICKDIDDLRRLLIQSGEFSLKFKSLVR